MFEVFADSTGAYRWRFRLPAGHVLALSGGSYLNRSLACQALQEFRTAARGAGPASGCREDQAGLRVVR
jgi:uncharacterized protein YegP (UPF0339 family)